MKLLFSFILTLFTCSFFGQSDANDKSLKRDTNKYEIRSLTKFANSESYGYTGENPVKVGFGPNGGPSNQRDYLSLLRDANGNPVKFKRVGGSCCAYKSANALFGDMALVDSYEITYQDIKGKTKKAIIYISFYDYEEPLIPIGLFSEEAKK